VRTSGFVLCCIIGVLLPAFALAQDRPLQRERQSEVAAEPPGIDVREKGSEPEPTPDVGDEELSARPRLGEAPVPPQRPRHKGLVLESTLGVLGFAGQFRHLAPPGSFIHAQLGYEILQWLMLFGEAELAFTDTSESQNASQSRAFALWGFGGGARAGVHVGNLGGFVQGDVGALAAQVPHDLLAYLGFREAERLSTQFGARVGVEWYQRDRHFALTVQGGPRVAEGFSKFAAASDLPLMWDVAAGLRYTF
jgi:hypothetical protein